jgi:hypothetical protein
MLLYMYLASYICSCHEDVLNVLYKFVCDNVVCDPYVPSHLFCRYVCACSLVLGNHVIYLQVVKIPIIIK